jgi:hypothetical protein
MAKIYSSGNYVIVQDGDNLYEYAKGHTLYVLSDDIFYIKEITQGQYKVSVADLDAGNITAEDSGHVYTVATFTTFLRENTGFKTASGGSGAEWGSITGTLSTQSDLQSALDSKQDDLISGTNIKSINGNSLLGSGDLVVGGSSGVWGISNTSGIYTYYATLTLAMAAAVAGQTIEMFADVLETGAVTITLKNGVNINGNGHTYTLDTATTTNAFIDGGVGVVMSISNITLVRKGAGSGAILGLSVAANRIVGFSTFLKVESNNSFGITNYGGAAFSGYINGFTVTATGTGSTGIYLVRANIDGCNSVATNKGISVIIGTLTNSYGESTGAGAGIEISNNGYASNCNGKSNTGYGISCGVPVSNSTGYSAGNYGIYAPSAFLTNCTGISAASFGIWGFGNRIDNCTAISTGAVASLIQNGVINGSTFYSSVNSGLNIFSSTAVYNSVISTLSGATTIVTSNATGNACLKNSSIVNDWNNVGGHAIPANASLVVANCSIKVANASSNCLNSSSAVTMKYANNSFEGATVPVNANITQGITNISDTKGNILI